MVTRIQDLVAVSQKTPTGKLAGSVVFTFDDGSADHYSTVFPVLQAKGKKATFFITQDLVGTPGYMTEAQILELHAAGMEIAAHHVSHQSIGSGTEAYVRGQLEGVKTYLAGLGINARTMAYVGGQHNEQARQLVLEYYDAARTTGAFPCSWDVRSPAAVAQHADWGDGETFIKQSMGNAIGGDCIITAHAVNAAGATMLGNLIDHADSLGIPVRTFVEAYDARVATKLGTHGLTLGKDGGLGASAVSALTVYGAQMRAQKVSLVRGRGDLFTLVDGAGNGVELQSWLGQPITINRQGNGTRIQGSAIGFFGSSGTAKPTVTGSRSDGTALASLLTALENLGLITNSTTA